MTNKKDSSPEDISIFIDKINSIKDHEKKLDFLRDTIKVERWINEQNWDKIRKWFTSIWTLERVKNMTLEEYTDTSKAYSFTYWIENELKDLWDIHGATSIKFWIYKSASWEYKYKKSLTSSEYYNYKLDGKEGAFFVIKNIVENIIKHAEASDLKSIDAIWELSPMFKWKIAFLYDTNEKIIPIYSYNLLSAICWVKEIENYTWYPDIYIRLAETRNTNTYKFSTDLLSSIDSNNTGDDYVNMDTFLLRYTYWLSRTDNNNSSWRDIITIEEHLDIFDEGSWKKVLWWILSTDSEKIRDKIEKIRNKKIKYWYLIWKSEEWDYILHRFNFNKIIERKDLQENDYNHIPDYYRDNNDVIFFINIKKIVQVSMGELDLYLLRNEWDIRNALSWTTSFFFLEKNPIWISKKVPSDWVGNGNISKLTEIIWIKIKSYQWLEDVWFINLSSNREYVLDWLGIIKDVWKKYNLFKEDKIDNLICILWKNGTWKSRIIRAILNYINNWQEPRNKAEEWQFYIYFRDSDSRIIKVNNNSFIWEIQSIDNRKSILKVWLDFSDLKNIFISNIANDSDGLYTNKILESKNPLSLEYSGYQYFWVMDNKRFFLTSSLNSYNNNLFTILTHPSTRKILDRALKKIEIDYSPTAIILSINNKEVPSSLKTVKNLFELIEWLIKEYNNSDLWAKSDFFKRNKSRKKVVELFNINKLKNSYEVTFHSQSKRKTLRINLNGNIKEVLKYYTLNEDILISNMNPTPDRTGLGLIDSEDFIISSILELLFKSNILNLDVAWVNKNGDILHLGQLSAWEVSIVTTLVKILYSLKLNSSNIIFYFDEPDSFLHPEMQRNLIYAIVSIIKEYKRTSGTTRQTSIILTTHSPIIASDIPKDNIIALDKKNWLAKIVQLESNPFLNNIYDNLKSGFFMKKYTWEYSRRKIKSKLNKLDENFLNIIWDEVIEYSYKNKFNNNEKN